MSTSLSAGETKQLEQLKLLFEYTKFHIGLYTTLAAAYIALMTSDYGKRFFTPNSHFVIGAIVMFGVAGFAGGIIASSCTHYSSFAALMSRPIAPFKDGWGFRGLTWTRIEHTAFWIGVVLAVWSFFPVHRKATIEVAASGNTSAFEWTIPAVGDYHQLVDAGSNRTILVCLDSGGHMELRVVQAGTSPTQRELGGANESPCQVVFGQVLFGKSKDGQPQTGRIAMPLGQ